MFMLHSHSVIMKGVFQNIMRAIYLNQFGLICVHNKHVFGKYMSIINNYCSFVLYL